MATSSNSACRASRPRRFTAIQAVQLLSEWNNEEDDEFDDTQDSEEERNDMESESEASSDDSDNRHEPARKTARVTVRDRGRSQRRPYPVDRANIPDNRMNWSDVSTDQNDAPGLAFPFEPAKHPGVIAELDDKSKELDCLFELLSPDVLDNLIDMINNHAKHKIELNTPPRRRSVYRLWKPIDRHELYKTLAILIAMGLDKRPEIRDYWSQFSPDYTPWYHKMIGRERFEAIYHTMLHASNVDSVSKEKIEPFLNNLLEKFQAAFYPFENMSIDEMVIGWKGRWKYKQYNASKPRKYHIKTFGLCDSTSGYVYNLLVYFGKETSYDPNVDAHTGQAEKVFEYLMRPLGKGHHVFADRYYTTERLVRYMSEMKTYYTGTLNINRKNFPADLKTLKLEHKQSRWYRSEDGEILCVAWRDKKAKKPMILVSTNASVNTINVTRKRGTQVEMPTIVHDYNMSMNGCDRVDQSVSYYGQFTRKTRKWWKRIFLWLLEICQTNAYILHSLTRAPDTRKLSLRTFKRNLIAQLEEMAVVSLPPSTSETRLGPGKPSLLEKFVGNKHLIKHVTADRNCVVCSTPENRRRTNFVCAGCTGNPYLHPKECFMKFHTAN